MVFSIMDGKTPLLFVRLEDEKYRLHVCTLPKGLEFISAIDVDNLHSLAEKLINKRLGALAWHEVANSDHAKESPNIWFCFHGI